MERKEAFSQVNFTMFEFMDSWTYQLGFPAIEFVKDESNPTNIYATQRFFKMDPLMTDYDHFRWKIPLFLKNSSQEPTSVVWLEEKANGMLV